MQVVFSCMDYKDPTKPFYFFVKVNEDRSYSGGSIVSKLVNTLESRQVPSIGCNELPPVVSVLSLPRRFHMPQTYLGPVIFHFKKSNFPFQKKLNSVSIPFHYWQRLIR